MGQNKKHYSPNTFIWKKLYSGNEHADTLAKEGAYSRCILHHKISLADTYSVLNINLKAKWNYQWYEYCFTNPTRYTRIHPNIPNKFWHEDFQVSRKYVTSLIRLKFGHACYPAHLYKIGVYTSPNCDQCNVTADLDHIFFGCAKYQNASNALISNIARNCKMLAPFSMLNLLCLGSKKIYTYIFGFLEETGIKL